MDQVPRRPSVRLTAEAWEALFRAQVAVMRRVRQDPVFRELPILEYDVLFNLSRHPGGWTRLHQLNEQLLISQPSLSRMVDRLERKGLIQRRPATGDQRGIELGLTEQGKALQRSIGSEHVLRIQELMGPLLSVDELEQLRAISKKISTGLDNPRLNNPELD